MYFTLSGCTAATMAMYVVKAMAATMAMYVAKATHVASAPTSLVLGAFAGDLWERSASQLSADAMLSGGRSRISMNSNAWIHTSLPGIGGKLDARWNGGEEGPAWITEDVTQGGRQPAGWLLVRAV